MNLIAATQMGGSPSSAPGFQQASNGSQDGPRRAQSAENGQVEGAKGKSRNIQNFHSIINYLRNTRSIDHASNGRPPAPLQATSPRQLPGDSQMAQVEQPRGETGVPGAGASVQAAVADHLLKTAPIHD